MHTGQVSERSKETVLKTVERKLRGFESRPVRHSLLEEARKSPRLQPGDRRQIAPDLGLPGGFLIRHCFIAESVPIHRLSFAGHRRSVTTYRIHRAPGLYHIQSRGADYNIHIPTCPKHLRGEATMASVSDGRPASTKNQEPLAKKVTLFELFYDLVFVYMISRATGLIHRLHEGVISPLALATFTVVVIVFINSWIVQTVFTNRYGKASWIQSIVDRRPVLLRRRRPAALPVEQLH